MKALAAVLAAAAGWRPAASARLPPPEMRVSFARHGSDWTQGNCASRNEQSPVNLNELYRPVDNAFSYFYANVHSQNITLGNDGRTISIDVTGEGFGGVSLPFGTAPWYSLKRIDIHAASEHTLRGRHLPLEVQLVHQASTISDPTAGHQLVTVSVLVDCERPPTKKLVWPGLIQGGGRSGGRIRGRGAGAQEPDPEPPQAAVPTDTVYVVPPPDDENFNPTIQVLVQKPPPIFDDEAHVSIIPEAPVQLGNLLAGGTYFVYRGSETLPPCEERVLWLVRRERVMASDAQVRALVDRLYTTSRGAGNYRTIMPLNQRHVRVWSASEREPPAVPLKPPSASELPLSSHDDGRESRAADLAKDAITIAKAASDYAKDLDLRLRAGSEAHLGALEAPAPAPEKPLPERVAREVREAVREAVAESAKQVVPAAADLARSYLRQELLHPGSVGQGRAVVGAPGRAAVAHAGGAVPAPAPAWSPLASPLRAPAALPPLAPAPVPVLPPQTAAR